MNDGTGPDRAERRRQARAVTGRPRLGPSGDAAVEPNLYEIREGLQCGRQGCTCSRANARNVHCPVHGEDREPSLTVGERNGTVLVHCKTGCAQDAVLAALRERGLWPDAKDDRRDAQPPPRPRPIQPVQEPARAGTPASTEPVVVYDYGAGIKGRFERADGSKDFRWRLKDSDTWDGLHGEIHEEDLPLYHADELSARPDDVVYVCEGEKATDAARAHGLLAVCSCGGGGQKKFGTAYALLRGRRVLIWPDNDVPGWRFGNVDKEHLREVYETEATLIFISGAARKHDAFDFFAEGNTVEQITEFAGPTAYYLDTNAFTILVNSPDGPIEFKFENLAAGRNNAITTLLSVQPWTHAASPRPLKQRTNITSSSAEDALARKCERMFPGLEKKIWAAVVNEAFSMAIDEWGERFEVVKDTDFDPPSTLEIPWAIRGVAPQGVTTILFGDGSAAKGYVALSAHVALATGGLWFGCQAEQMRSLYVDWEADQEAYQRRLRRIKRGLGMDPDAEIDAWYLNANGVPLHDLIDAIRRRVREYEIGVIFIDSAAVAAGADSETSTAATQFHNALNSMPGVTKIVIAHVTKAVNGPNSRAAEEKPFGSTFWANGARMTWFVKRVSEIGDPDLYQVIKNRKSNDAPLQRDILTHLHFEDPGGPVSFNVGSWNEAPAELTDERSMRDRVWEALQGRMMPIEIQAALCGDDHEEHAAELGTCPIKVDTIKKTLQRMEKRGHVVRIGGAGQRTHWAKAAKVDSEPVSTDSDHKTGTPAGHSPNATFDRNSMAKGLDRETGTPSQRSEAAEADEEGAQRAS